MVYFSFLDRAREAAPRAPGADNLQAERTPSPRQPNAVPTKSLLGSLPAAGAADLTRKPVLNPWRGGRPSSAHVSGGLRGPFWDQFWLQKWSFFILFRWSRGSSLDTCFSEDFFNPSPLKFDRFALCPKKPHTSSDPQKPMDFHIFSIFATPQSTQQGTQQRTKKA